MVRACLDPSSFRFSCVEKEGRNEGRRLEELGRGKRMKIMEYAGFGPFLSACSACIEKGGCCRLEWEGRSVVCMYVCSSMYV